MTCSPGINETQDAEAMTECRLLLYYDQEPDQDTKVTIQDAVTRWSKDLGGSEPVVEYEHGSEWLQELIVWLPKPIAIQIVKSGIERGLRFLFPPKPLDDGQVAASRSLPTSTETPIAPDAAEQMLARENAGHLRQASDEERYARIARLEDYLPGLLSPTRQAFIHIPSPPKSPVLLGIDPNGDEFVIERNEKLSALTQRAEEWISRSTD